MGAFLWNRPPLACARLYYLIVVPEPMPPPKPDIHGMSIVLVGNFNPAIFHGAWFAKFGLLPEEEAADITDQVIVPDFAQFTLAWLQLQVTPDRFMLASTDPESFNLLRDLAIGTFRILRHSPVRAVGINRDQHYRVPSVQRYHEIGLTLAPASNWAGPLQEPGMRSLVVQGVRQDGYEGNVLVRVEPSQQFFPGLYVGINDHFQLGETQDDLVDAERAIEVLEREWDASIQRVQPLIDVALTAKATASDRAEAKRRAEAYERKAAAADKSTAKKTPPVADKSIAKTTRGPRGGKLRPSRRPRKE